MAAARLGSLAGGRDPFDTFDWIMDTSESRGLQSGFYFIVDGPAPELGCGYSIDDPAVRELIRRCASRGHEIGLHASYTSFDDDAAVVRDQLESLKAVCRAEGFEQDAWGGRQHYLRWDAGRTWSAWASAGLAYDSTVGYHDAPGFRCGTCSEFPTFDHDRRVQLALRERPLVIMDVALDRGEPDVDRRAELITELKRQCRRHGGQFVVLWHNSRLFSLTDRRLYLHALDA
jgi:hypothetical protein